MSEQSYYDNPGLWRPERYLLDENEQARYRTCAGLLPAGARTLLDVGTGNGAFLRHLEDGGDGRAMQGLERAGAAISAAVCRSPIHPGSADDLPFADRSVDVVSALEVIEHFPYGVYEKALAEIERVAARSILISVPYREKRRRAICPYCGCDYSPDYHMRSFDETVLSGLFAAFRVERFAYVSSRNEYLFAPVLWNLRQIVTGQRKRPKPTAVCPQCGYSARAAEARANPAAAPAAWPPARSRAGRMARAVLPAVSRVRWIVALYARAG